MCYFAFLFMSVGAVIMHFREIRYEEAFSRWVTVPFVRAGHIGNALCRAELLSGLAMHIPMLTQVGK